MAPKKVVVKTPNLATDVKVTIAKLTKAKPKVSTAAKGKIDLEIRKLRAFEKEMKVFCHGTMTHAFDPAGGDPQ
jgi:hypothetical protein